jgi:hypothetical protein
MDPQRPSKRPATQVPQRRSTHVPAPQPGKSPTSRQPAVRPGTSRQPAVKPPTVHTSPTTRMPQERATTRSVPRSSRSVAGKKSQLPLILGVAGGGLLLIIILAVALSGTKKPVEASNPKPPVQKVDVSTLERDGMRKCEEGVVQVQRSYNSADKAGLQRGVALITEGNQMLDQANQMSGHTYDTKKFNETLKMARGKLLELK